MKRISTFKMFEAEQKDTDLLTLCDALNVSAKELGCHFGPDPQFGISSYNVPLRRGFYMDNGAKRMVTPAYRSLIMSVLFGIPEENQSGYLLDFYDSRVQAVNYKVFDWVGVEYTSGRFAYEDGMSFHNGHCIHLSQSAGLAANVITVTNCLKKMIAKIGFIKCQADDTKPGGEVLDFEDLVPALVPALASYVLGESEGVRLICDVVREAGDSRNSLIGRIKELAPALWQDLIPALGTGATETGELADLGF